MVELEFCRALWLFGIESCANQVQGKCLDHMLG